MHHCHLRPQKPKKFWGGPPEWQCTIEIAWVDLGHPYPGPYKQEILTNRGQKVRSRLTGAIQLCTASETPLNEAD